MRFDNIITIAWFFLLFQTGMDFTYGQERLLKKAFKQIELNNWQDYEEAVNKYLENGGQKNDLYHYLNSIFYQKGPGNDPFKWHSELIIAYTDLGLLSDSEKDLRCTKYQFCQQAKERKIVESVQAIFIEFEKLNTISDWRNYQLKYGQFSLELNYQADKNIENLAFARAKATNTEEGYTYFLRTYPEASKEKLEHAKNKLEELAFERVVKENNKATYVKFLANFPGSSRIGVIKDKIEKIDYLQVSEYLNENEVRKFMKDYPDSKFIKELNHDYFNMAASDNDIVQFREFLNLFEPSDSQIEHIAKAADRGWDRTLLDFFIEEFPFHQRSEVFRENLKWMNETDSLIELTKSYAQGGYGPNLIPGNVSVREDGVVIDLLVKKVKLLNEGDRNGYDEMVTLYHYDGYIPLLKQHIINVGYYEGWGTILLNDIDGSQTTLYAEEFLTGATTNIQEEPSIFRFKKELFFATLSGNEVMAVGFGFNIYSYSEGKIEMIHKINFDPYNDLDFPGGGSYGWRWKMNTVNFAKTNNISFSIWEEDPNEPTHALLVKEYHVRYDDVLKTWSEFVPPPPPPALKPKSYYDDNVGMIVQTNVEPIADVVEEKAEYPGGQSALLAWLNKNIEYPEIAAQSNIQGRVFVQIVVEKDGSISDVKTIGKVPHKTLGKEAVKKVKRIPGKWTPGKNNGKAVRSYFKLPVMFRLK